MGLAASYDQLRRFELADRAYAQAVGLVGKSPEVLNNQGYSYILRGDYTRARVTLLQAKAKDPDNPYIQNNLELLEKSVAQGQGRAAELALCFATGKNGASRALFSHSLIARCHSLFSNRIRALICQDRRAFAGWLDVPGFQAFRV